MKEPLIHSESAVMELEDLDSTVSRDIPVPDVAYFGLTDRGKVRPRNEDHFLAATLVKSLNVQHSSLPQTPQRRNHEQTYLFIIADGMGGHAAGERASALAIDSVEDSLLKTFRWFGDCTEKRECDAVLAAFKKAIGHANSVVHEAGAGKPEWHGMGTTLTLAYILRDHLFVAHAGDSRCYLLREGNLYRLTSDHTLAEEMVRRGLLSPGEVPDVRLRHVVTNAVGGNKTNVKVEMHELCLEANDTVLLCSDGLTGMSSERDILCALQGAADPEEACRELLDQAKQAGGKDNITVIVVKYRAASQLDY